MFHMLPTTVGAFPLARSSSECHYTRLCVDFGERKKTGKSSCGTVLKRNPSKVKYLSVVKGKRKSEKKGGGGGEQGKESEKAASFQFFSLWNLFCSRADSGEGTYWQPLCLRADDCLTWSQDSLMRLITLQAKANAQQRDASARTHTATRTGVLLGGINQYEDFKRVTNRKRAEARQPSLTT